MTKPERDESFEAKLDEKFSRFALEMAEEHDDDVECVRDGIFAIAKWARAVGLEEGRKMTSDASAGRPDYIVGISGHALEAKEKRIAELEAENERLLKTSPSGKMALQIGALKDELAQLRKQWKAAMDCANQHATELDKLREENELLKRGKV